MNIEEAIHAAISMTNINMQVKIIALAEAGDLPSAILPLVADLTKGRHSSMDLGVK